jgi:hypothetical protein
MTIKDITDARMLHPVKTADGRRWVQRCFVCSDPVNFINRDPHVMVGELVRHRKCYPEAVR